jgi:hypothetical protein
MQNFQYLQHAITKTIGKKAVKVLEINHIFVSSNTSNIIEKTMCLKYGKKFMKIRYSIGTGCHHPTPTTTGFQFTLPFTNICNKINVTTLSLGMVSASHN